MGRHYHFKPGSFYRVDDRTGFPQRAEHTRKQWNNLIVDEKIWEPRQPQDLVRGVKDQQSVQDARPLSPPLFVGPVWTTTSYAVPIGESVIPVESLSSFSIGDKVAIMTDRDGGVLTWGIVIAAGLLSFSPNSDYLATESGLFVTTEEGQFLLLDEDEFVPAIEINYALAYPVSSGAQVWNYGLVA